MTPQPTNRFRAWWPGAALLALVVVAYLPALRGGFIWDDDAHVTANPCIVGPLGLTEIWTTAAANYFPLVLTNFWVQHALWGLVPWPYHLVTLLCHAFAAVLLWRVLRALRVPGAWLGAALWALHPVQVESVAWIAELKNTQSGIFFLLSVLFFARWLEEGEDARLTRPAYLLALLGASCALLSKPSTVMLPLVLGLVAWWRRGALRWRDAWSLAPFLVPAATASGWTIWEQKFHSGALGPDWNQTLLERIAISGKVVWFYLGKLLWPHPLVFVYPRWAVATRLVDFVPFVAALAALAVLGWRRGTRARPVFIAAVFFGALLFPVLDFFNVYFFRYAFVGDHFQYLASIGPLALLAAAAVTLLPRAAPALGAAALATCAVLTWQQAGTYASNETLWRTTVARNPECGMAWLNLGDMLAKQGAHDEAVACFARAAELKPDDPEAQNDLGCELDAAGRYAEGLPHLLRAVQLKPDFPEAQNNLGNALRFTGRAQEAIGHYVQAFRLKPDYAEAHNNLGCGYAELGRFDEALTQFDTALRLKPDDPQSHSNLANVLRNLGRTAEAAAHYARAVQVQPDFGEAHHNYGLLLASTGRLPEALEQFAEAARLLPRSADVHNNFGTALSQSGRLPEAVGEFERAIQLDSRGVRPRRNRGDALSRLGRWPDAIASYQDELQLAPDDADGHANLGVALANAGRPQEALPHFEQALRLRPDFVEAHNNLGELLRTLGREREALEHFEAAAQIQRTAPRRP